jgi:galactose-1-phosphate uridylyltransferase
MTWNYMPPSGGGLVHPHQQYFATAHPGNQFMDELSASQRFAERYRQNYWYVLARREAADNERYIARLGSGHWMASFVSLGLLGEVMCVFPDVFSLDDFTDDDIDDLVAGLERVFRYYEDAGVFSFNASLSFGPSDQEHFSCYFRIVPRTFLNTRDFAPDLNFFQAILSEPICVVLPEDLCREVKPYFK